MTTSRRRHILPPTLRSNQFGSFLLSPIFKLAAHWKRLKRKTPPAAQLQSLGKMSSLMWKNHPGRILSIEARFAMDVEMNISLARDTIALGARIMISAKNAWTLPKRRPLIHRPTKWMPSYPPRRCLLFYRKILSYLPPTLLRTTEKLSA